MPPFGWLIPHTESRLRLPAKFTAVYGRNPYNGEGAVIDLETAFFELNSIIQKMDNGECFRITRNGINALGISSDAVKIALQILGLVPINNQVNEELTFAAQ